MSFQYSKILLVSISSFLWQACVKCTEDQRMDCLSRMFTASVRSIGDTSNPSTTSYSGSFFKFVPEDVEKSGSGTVKQLQEEESVKRIQKSERQQ